MEELYYALYDFLTDSLLTAGNECELACVRACARKCVFVREERERGERRFGTEGIPWRWWCTEEKALRDI